MDGRRTSNPVDNNHNKISHMDRLPNEILRKIIYQVLISSNFVSGLTTDVTFTIKCAMPVNTRFRHGFNPKGGFSDSAGIYFSSDGVAGNVSVKKLVRMYGPSSGIVFELRRIISNQKWANA